MEEVNYYVEVPNELQSYYFSKEDYEKIVTSSSSTIIEHIDTLNSNVVYGSLGIIICLGFVFGALLGSIYANITR